MMALKLFPGTQADKGSLRVREKLFLPLTIIGLIFFVALVVSVYLIASAQLHGIGFPLDDAWIHQTYARNLALYGEWAFSPGYPSSGSTAPLWSVLLAVGYWLNLSFFFWTFFLGSLCLFGLAWMGERLLRVFQPELTGKIPWAGLFLTGEWHFAWAAVSGMETLLFSLMILFVLFLSGHVRGRQWAWVGLLIGISIWVRPDGITLLGPAAFILLFSELGWTSRFHGYFWLAFGLVGGVASYLVFNLSIQGSILPNTFYAKQAEYVVERQVPLLLRLLDQLRLPLIGGGMLLLPGALWTAWQAWHKKNWLVMASLLWFLGYAFLYALRLPVVYQYGRYFMPAMPVYFLLGIAGTYGLMHRLRSTRFTWLLSRVWLFSTAGIWLAFIVLGANRYAQDVAIIDTEMVAAARWVADNTPPDSLVAAHDIGALGFFGNREIIDLAGLVSPEVIPFIRDEARIAAWLDELAVDYLVVLSDWYPYLPVGKEPVFQTNGSFSPLSGGSNIWIYRWKP